MKFSLNRSSLIALGLAMTASLSAGFAFADSKQEGKKGPRHHGMFERMDVNKDGKITKDEARKMSEERFGKLDANKDGVITQDEAKAAHEKRREERAKKHGGKDHPKHKGGHKHGPGHLFAKLDVNKDGKITRAEAQKVADERFAKMDTNQDGAITKQEAIEAHKARMKNWKEKREGEGGKKGARADNPSGEKRAAARKDRPNPRG